jgi:hypothetical protein
MSPELETLDQLLGGDLPLATIRGLYPDDASFQRGVLGLLQEGDIALIADGDVPQWRWRDVLAAIPHGFILRLTEQGAKKIA